MDLSETPSLGDGQSERIERLENRYYGKYRGVVIDNLDPQQLGRVRVWVPSLFPQDASADASGLPGTDDPIVSEWAWPCVPFGGLAEQGTFFVPENGAKVWVEYEEGNLDNPIWVGTFWSAPGGTSEVPTEAKDMQDNDPKRRVLKTSSGHVLEFSDVDGHETVTIRHKDGAMLYLDEHGSVTVGNKEGTFLYLNAEHAEASMVDENGNNIRLGDSNVTLTNKDGSVVDVTGSAVQVVAKNVILRSDTVSLGEGAMEPAILGRTFAAMYDSHTHPTAFGPSGPPIPVPMPLSAPTNPAISKSVMVK
jgi:uncharacterized protein involved in type VI secretion and phage assembly